MDKSLVPRFLTRGVESRPSSVTTHICKH